MNLSITLKDKKQMKTFFMLLGALLLIPTLIVIGTLINGCVLSVIWDWFMVPIFGLTALSIPEAIGVSMVVTHLTFKHKTDNREKTEKEKKADTIDAYVHFIGYPLLVLVLGYIVKGFM